MIQTFSTARSLAVLLTAIISVSGVLIWLRIAAWLSKQETKRAKITGLEE